MRSVCIATFNGGRYLREQLDSILQQLAEEDEVIISDDGSVDDTWAILNDYAEKDHRIKLFEGPKQGLIANFGYAIQQAKGELIFLADQDDVWLEHKVEKITDYFKKNPDKTVVVSDLVIVDSELKEIHASYFSYRRSKEGWLNNLIRSHYIGAGMAFRSTLKKEILPIPADVPMHDMWIGLLGGKHTGFLREPLTLYRRHDFNASEIETHSSLMQKLSWRVHLAAALIKRRGFKH
ncbi:MULTISPECIES: glycosyltransferase family 2 protein [unclassified Enterococcus]|uniref:glycosyltransferase family 2 protein n=1 Tax=unclassified Enterococcus TaxID=2608891 RepID=UPI0013E9CF6D|nr:MULTISPECIES: glycosyltransferase family 2 protein [unclassified Enterococcus]